MLSRFRRPLGLAARRSGACALLLATVGLAACEASTTAPAAPDPDDDPTTEAAPGLDPLYDPVTLAVSVEESRVTLGDAMVFRVRLTNGGPDPVRVNVPRLGRNSLSFRVRKDGRVGQVERLNAELNLTTGRIVWKPGEVRELAAGGALDAEVSLVAVEAGTFAYTPVYKRAGADPLASDPVEVTVEPQDGKLHLGVQMETSHGALTARLRPDLAYNTVESFASLVKKGFYDGLTFHRVVKGFMAQGGDPKADGTGGPGYFIPLEAHTKLLHRRGVLSMARTNHPDTGGSQFFLLFTRYPSLDPDPRRRGTGYAVFGEVMEGDQTLRNLESVGAQPKRQGDSEAPIERVEIKSATLVAID